MAKRTGPLPIRPDNVRWDDNGMLLSAGRMPAGGWSAIEIDPQTFAVTVLGGADGDAVMQRVSAAIRVGNEVWVGSNQDRIARFPLN